MSHEICKSISRIYQTEDGKWTATITSAVNNVRPLTYRKVNFIPLESKRKMIAAILHDIYDGSIHMQGKTPYKAFLDECYYGIVKSPAWDKIRHLEMFSNKIWSIYSDHNYWHGQDCKAKMDEKYRRISQKIHCLTKSAEEEWAAEFENWKADTARYHLYIDGYGVVSFKTTKWRLKWRYRYYLNDTTALKQFTAVEIKKIQKRLEGTYKVEVRRIDKDGNEMTENVA